MVKNYFYYYDKIKHLLSSDNLINNSFQSINNQIKKEINKIFLIKLPIDRIGHLALNSEDCLREYDVNYKYYYDNKYLILFVVDDNLNNLCNRQLYNMIKSTIPIIDNIIVIKLIEILSSYDSELWDKTLYCKYYYYVTSHNINAFNQCKPQLKFAQVEEKKGINILEQLGIDEEKQFICFHNRDNKYLDTVNKIEMSHNEKLRDSDIQNYIPAIESIVEDKNFYAIRIGKQVKQKINFDNDKILDFSEHEDGDFTDIYFLAKCKFFLCSISGTTEVAHIFNVPVVATNLLHIGIVPFRDNDLYIMKKFWYKEEKRFLKYSELIKSKAWDWMCLNGTNNFEKLGIEVIQNTPQEIMDVCDEMLQRLNGTWITTDEDEYLQKKVWNLYTKESYSYGFKSRVGTKFLRENKDLID